MKTLADEILKRFPEVEPSVFGGDEELAYVMMGHLVDWVVAEAKDGIEPDMVSRLRAFAEWCQTQPEGESAADDIWTVYVVGFYEKMFMDEATRPLIPELANREDLILNREYLITWVGQDAYDAALKRFR